MVCTLTGHRKFDDKWYGDRPLKLRLQEEIDLAVDAGCKRFISGFAAGADTLFAQLILEKKESGASDIELEAAIPFRDRYNSLMNLPKMRTLLEACSHIEVLSEYYHGGVYMMRNRYMLEHADRVIAVYDGRKSGGTYATIRLARQLDRDLRIIYIGDPKMQMSLFDLFM